MKQGMGFLRLRPKILLGLIASILLICTLMLYRLGSLTGGLSSNELRAAIQPLGWHGIWADALYLPLKFIRSIVFFTSPDHGQLLSRLPNAFFGGLSILSLGWLLWLWHGTRTALLATLMFATGAWTLHASRLASYDALYLWAVPTLLLMQVLLHRYGQKAIIWYAYLLLNLLILYIPGMIWLIAVQSYMQRKLLVKLWRQVLQPKQRAITALISVVALPLLIKSLLSFDKFITWLGLPESWPAPLQTIKNFINVFINLFISGPKHPELWLGRAPLLDAFALIVCGLGIYFYLKNIRAWRSRLLCAFFIIGVILVTVDGPVGLSVLVPLLYIAMAAGLSFLLHDWLKTFPINPFARGLGIGLVGLAVAVSCIYNLRSYFVVWPNTDSTVNTFRYQR
jgi:hypothetical protein